MLGRIAATMVVGFWVVMMTALVRTEYLGERGGPEVPAKLVLKKIFSQESPARLNVFYQNELIGFCKVEVSPVAADGPQPAVLPAAYRVDSSLVLTLDRFGFGSPLRAEGETYFNAQYGVTAYQLSVKVDDLRLVLAGDTATRKVSMDLTAPGTRDRREFDLGQLSGAGLAGVLGLPGLGMLNPGVLTNATAATGRNSATVRMGRLPIGSDHEDAYLVAARLNESLWARIWISKQGEVLKVDTPFQVTLLADTLTEIQSRYPDQEGRHDLH